MPLPRKTIIDLHDVTIQGANCVLEAISLEVPEHSRFAVLCSPKSGKTTFIKTLAGLTSISSGSGYVLNYPLGDSRITTGGQIGFLYQDVSWHGGLTVLELLELHVRHYPTQEPLVDLAVFAGLEKHLHVTATALSTGERQCLGLMMLHIQNPSLLILDDPTYGLAATERNQVLDLIDRISKERTLVFTSSYLADARHLSTHIALLHQGRILAHGDADAVLSEPEAAKYRVVLRGDASIVYENIHDLAWISNIQASSKGDATVWDISLLESAATSTSLLRAILADRGLDIVQFNLLRPRIDHFLAELEQSASAAG